MKKTIILLVTVLFIFVIIFALASTIITDYNLAENIELLETSNKKTQTEKFLYTELKGLPTIVQKYFRLNIERGVYKPKTLRVQFASEIKMNPNSDWKILEAEQYFLTRQPGYVWNGSIQTNEFIRMRVIDSFINGNAKITFKLLSAINMGEHIGKELNHSALARYLMDAVYFPTMLLPSEYIEWNAISSSSAIVKLTFNDISVSAVCSFNTLGEIIKIETEDRYKATKTGIIKTKFISHHSHYRTFGGLSVPTKTEIEIAEQDSTFKYQKIELLDVHYNNLEIFEIRNK